MPVTVTLARSSRASVPGGALPARLWARVVARLAASRGCAAHGRNRAGSNSSLRLRQLDSAVARVERRRASRRIPRSGDLGEQ